MLPAPLAAVFKHKSVGTLPELPSFPISNCQFRRLVAGRGCDLIFFAMQDTADTLPAHPERNRSSRRSRPSLAAFTDSGYAPTQRSSQNQPYKQTSTIGRSQTRSTISFAVPVPDDRNADGSDPVDLGVASQLADESFASLRASLRGMSDIIRTYRGYDGPEESDTMRRNGGTARKDGTGRFAHRPGPTNSSGSSQYPKASTISRSATISSAWSGVSNRLFVESLREPSSDAGHNTFTESFDKLARKHGIQPFPKDFSKELGSVSVSSGSRASSADSTSTLPGNKLWNKLLGRTPHTVDISKHHGNSKLSIRHRRKNSMGDLTGFVKGKRDMLKGMHLEDMIRLGGVAVFNLPRGLSPGDLLIPTCIHAAATHILNHG